MLISEYDIDFGDGILIESEGSTYTRYAQYIPQTKYIYEQFLDSHLNEIHICCPIEIYQHIYDYPKDNCILDNADMVGYADDINAFIYENDIPAEHEKGLMHWYHPEGPDDEVFYLILKSTLFVKLEKESLRLWNSHPILRFLLAIWIISSIKNLVMTSLAASFLASIGGTAVTGAIIGEKVTGKKAKVIGLVAGGACGLVAGVAVKTVGNLLHEDDAVITTRMFNAVMTNMIIDHMLSDKEVDLLIKELDDKNKELANLQKALLSSNSQASDISAFLLPIINSLTEKREKVDEKCNGQFMDSIADLLMNGDLAYGV